MRLQSNNAASSLHRPPYPAGSELPDREDSVLVRAERLSCSLGARSIRDMFGRASFSPEISNSSAPRFVSASQPLPLTTQRSRERQLYDMLTFCC